MARITPVTEDHYARTLTGSAVVSRTRLGGWGAMNAGVPALETFTDNGRLWWKYTVSSTTLELFRRPTMQAADRVAYDDGVADGKADLVQDISSGITGSCDIDEGTPGVNPTADATGDLILSYASEADLLSEYADVVGYLDSDSQWYDQDARFEALLKAAKRELDESILARGREFLADAVRHDPTNSAYARLLNADRATFRRTLLASLDPRQFATVHAIWCAYKLESHRVGEHAERAEIAQWHMDRATRLLQGLSIELDVDADGTPDVTSRTVDRTLKRT